MLTRKIGGDDLEDTACRDGCSRPRVRAGAGVRRGARGHLARLTPGRRIMPSLMGRKPVTLGGHADDVFLLPEVEDGEVLPWSA